MEWRELPSAADAVRDPGGADAATGAPAMPGAPFPDPDIQGPVRRDASWILSLAVIAAAFAFWHRRVAIALRWPPSLRLYRLPPQPPSG